MYRLVLTLSFLLLFIPAPQGLWADLLSTQAPLAGVILGLFLFVFGLSLALTSPIPSKAAKAVSTQVQAVPAPQPVVAAPKDRRIKQKDIVDYFLEIYRHQMKAAPDAPADAQLVETRRDTNTNLYLLRVKQGEKWCERRMTIANIGEDAAARSRVFYVIYNKHIIVKIPPKPVTDFSIYINQMRGEWAIARRLAPRDCIVPRLAGILSLYHSFADIQGLSWQAIEEKYIAWAAKVPRYQEKLMINGAFAFFMELSTENFLGKVIFDLHDSQKRLADELRANPDICKDSRVFSGRYGDMDIGLCFDLQRIYQGLERSVADALADKQDGASFSLHRLPQWFCDSLAGCEPTHQETGLKLSTHRAVSQAVARCMEQHGESLETYRAAMSDHVDRISFQQNKPKIAGLVTNILDMLAWLNEKKVALRDIKPDNLLVVGEPGQYPGYLSTPERFAIGFIDVETSVVFDPDWDGEIKQPPLAGTPVYATASHLFDNGLIKALLGDLPLVLHLQDWHAVVGLIYKSALNRTLFENAARNLASVAKIMQSPQARHENPAHFAREASRVFWNGAATEFHQKIRRHRAVLSQLQVAVPPSCRGILLSQMADAKKAIDERMCKRVDSQTAVAGEAGKEKLLSATQKMIVRKRRKIQDESPEPTDGQKELLCLLADLSGY
ncbi:MAG: hypothetical protein QMD09_14305, partial [Desulfatibacillaceae bacterium]|nr:hypothetical protein [Desulfatibacillaceae bacterium]